MINISPTDVAWEVAWTLQTNGQGFVPSPLNSAFLAGRRYPGSMRSVLIDGFCSESYSAELCQTPC